MEQGIFLFRQEPLYLDLISLFVRERDEYVETRLVP